VIAIDSTPSMPLIEDVELANVLARTGDDYKRKGFFFHRHVKAVGASFESIRATLEEPPRLGVYLPFNDYPARDYMRLFHHAARTRYPSLAPAQAYRLLGREEIGTYLELSVGRVSFGMFGGPMAAFLAWSELAKRLVNRPVGVAHRVHDRHVRIEFTDPVSSLPYGVGVFEGIVLAYNLHPRVAVREEADRTTFDIRWDV